LGGQFQQHAENLDIVSLPGHGPEFKEGLPVKIRGGEKLRKGMVGLQVGKVPGFCLLANVVQDRGDFLHPHAAELSLQGNGPELSVGNPGEKKDQGFRFFFHSRHFNSSLNPAFEAEKETCDEKRQRHFFSPAPLEAAGLTGKTWIFVKIQGQHIFGHFFAGRLCEPCVLCERQLFPFLIYARKANSVKNRKQEEKWIPI
jgi:hypothetical protein